MSMMLIVLAPIMMLAAVAGCVQTSPNNSDFEGIRSLYDLQGIYQNRGERSDAGTPYPIFLSAILWPKEELNHVEVETIEVKALSADSIVVRAISKRGVEREGTFFEGQQLKVADGRIRLKQEIRIAGTRPGEPLVGPAYEHLELGIDRRGQGKYRKEDAAVGLVYLFLPFAFAEREDLRFLRVEP